MSIEYVESKEVEEVANKLIPDMPWEVQPKIKFLMLVKDNSSYLGKCSRATKKWKHLTNFDYIIEVFSLFWDSANDNQKEALLWHELSHIGYKEDESTGEIVWKLRKHDVEEFVGTVQKYGIWNSPFLFFNEGIRKGDVHLKR